MPANRFETALAETERALLILKRQQSEIAEEIRVLEAAKQVYIGTHSISGLPERQDDGRDKNPKALSKGAISNHVKTFVLGRKDETVTTKQVNEYVARQTGRPPSETRNAVHMVLVRLKQREPELKWSRE